MGLSFRKSFKIGKNTRINLSKTGGIGISTGVKGARVSVNNKGVRTQVGAKGIYYREDHSFKKGSHTGGTGTKTVVSNNPKIILSENVAKAKKQHTKMTLIMYACFFIGFVFPPLFGVTVAMALYIFINKKSRLRMNVSTAAYNLQAFKLDKARSYLEKARKIDDNELVQELENDINNVENMIME
jgi:ABC-type multidrug transport system fused ATPase/permease subunit